MNPPTHPAGPLRNRLLERLRSGDLASIMSVRLNRGPEIAYLAATAGFDALYVDLEHCTMSADDASRICLAALGAGITPLVRVPVVDAAHVPRLLDGGAMGIIGPHIRTAEEARALVSLCKFPPCGTRSSVAALPQLAYRPLAAMDVHDTMNRATVVIAMVEDEASLAQVEDIAAVEGLDAILVGTQDLCASLGLGDQADHPLIDAAFARTIRACRAHDKWVGVGGLARNRTLLRRYVDMGAGFLSLGTDLSFLLDGARQQVAVLESLRQPR